VSVVSPPPNPSALYILCIDGEKQMRDQTERMNILLSSTLRFRESFSITSRQQRDIILLNSGCCCCYCCWARSLIPPLSQTTFLSIHLCWHHGREREMGGRLHLMSYHIYREKKYRRSGRLYSVLFFFSAHSLMQMLRSNIYRGSLIIRG
jgi:hypothetical protein